MRNLVFLEVVGGLRQTFLLYLEFIGSRRSWLTKRALLSVPVFLIAFSVQLLT
jgi:hypothetical protein